MDTDPLFLSLLALMLAGAVVPSTAAAQASAERADGPTTQALTELHERYRVGGLEEREFSPETFWQVLGPLVDRPGGPEREEIGRSAQDRPLHLVRYGGGPTTVLLWSQMHGDESTATMALADLFHFFATAPDHPLARRIADELTVLAIPMLNPDGAAHFQRRNAQGIDINRDAGQQATPEARALKRVQERFQPMFGFNLHDQNVRTRVAGSNRAAAIGLLAPEFDTAGSANAVRTRAKQVAVVFRHAVEPLVGGHITRYDASYMSRAFGDNMQRWGVSTVLVESGGWKDDPEKQFLRKVNFAGLLSAFEAIATGRYEEADAAEYTDLPENGRTIYDLLIHGGTVVASGLPHYRADLALNYEKPLERRGAHVERVGELAGFTEARDTLDLSGLYLHPQPAGSENGSQGMALRDGMPARFIVRRGPDPTSEAVWILDGGPPRRPESRGREN
jgi:hypothetical protein